MKQDYIILMQECRYELVDINRRVKMNRLDKTASYLTNYAIIRACGTIETVYKGILTDFVTDGAKPQVCSYFEKRLRKSSSNPSKDNIIGMLKIFDATWKTNFLTSLSGTNHFSSLDSLVTLRNGFAHGNNPTTSIEKVRRYFQDACRVLKMLDTVVC